MVSFQCHSCGDVVKKPKLDQHQSRCHSGFDCIDCSTTFNTPADYKSHTSCISEAEKYQKALYKGPKAGNNRNYQQNSGPRGHGNNSSNGYQNQRGGYGGRPPWSQPRNQATGSNDTPLGTPRRSPVTKVDGPEKSNSATDVVAESTQMTEKVKEGKEKEKNKKRKHEDEPKRESDKAPTKKVKVYETAVDSASIPLPQSQEEEKKRRKKDKKEKKEKSGEEVHDDKTVDKEKKRKEKREKKEKQGKDVGEELNEKKEKRDKKEKKDKKDKSERSRVKSEK